MFKKGDIVEVISLSPGMRGYTIGNKYEVCKDCDVNDYYRINGANVPWCSTVSCDLGVPNSIPFCDVKVVGKAAGSIMVTHGNPWINPPFATAGVLAIPKFKKGDRVECLKDSPGYLTAGKFYIIQNSMGDQVFMTNDNGLYDGFNETFFKLAFQGTKIDMSKNPSQKENICTCESLMLFRHGCKCGAIKKQKWGLGA